MTKTKSIKKAKPTPFTKHVQLEKLVLEEIAEREILRNLRPEARSRKKLEAIFVENTGAVELYSMSEAESNFNKAEEVYGDDRAKYAKGLLKDLAKSGNRKNLAGPPPAEALKNLRRDFPNFGEAIDQIEYAAALSHMADKAWFQMQPLLLLGPPGVGKTAFAQAFANILNIYFRRIDVGTMSTGSVLAGLSLGWGSGHVGEVFKTITTSHTANPLIMLDEVDKMAGHYMAPMEPLMLSLLEKESSATFRDEALLLRVNCSRILWIATANDLDNMSEPLKSRFNIVDIKAPSKEHLPNVLQSIYRKILQGNPWWHKFANMLDDEVLKRLSGYSPRQASNALLLALGKAAVSGNRSINPNDIRSCDSERSKIRMGFL